ncbi:mitochondrial import protein Pam17 [Mucidula mucida]|nr:mitochondrial import protein Pam17 [Mucidula mucida]
MERCISRRLISSVRRTSLPIRGTVRFNSTNASQPLPWSEYLAMRKSRHRWQTVATVPGTLLGLFGGAAYFGSLDTDPTKPIMGIDPFMFYGASTALCMLVGFMVAPTAGGAAWRLAKSSHIERFDSRDAEFFKRVAKHRVDASLASMTPPPDYYGEKIGSLHEYRLWLRDQGKYRRKAILPES